jgi:hypothetical protein
MCKIALKEVRLGGALFAQAIEMLNGVNNQSHNMQAVWMNRTPAVACRSATKRKRLPLFFAFP